MDLLHIFYKELPVDDDNIFSANLAENNEIEEISLRKSQKYMVTGLSINQKADTDVIIPDLNARKSLSGMIRSYKKERKKINLDCHFYQKDLFDITIPFKKRSDVFTTGPTYFDTTTKKLCLSNFTTIIIILQVLVLSGKNLKKNEKKKKKIGASWTTY